VRRAAALLLLFALHAPATVIGPRQQRAIDWLWSQQESDGGWHSRTYGLLRSGQSLTPFVLLALLENDPAEKSERVDRALSFIRAHVATDGSLGRMDEYSQDYPNYATALAVRAIVRAGRSGWREEVAPMMRYLRLQQFTEQNGWGHEDAAYGAWGMGGERLRPPGTGHVDLSMTRHVLEALRDAGVDREDPLWAKAHVYLSRLQNEDGGFFFSTTEEDTNKAGGRRSYGTATADGILALLASGVAEEDPRVRRAMTWLQANHRRADRIPGFAGPAYERWHRGLAFYYAAALGELHPAGLVAVQAPAPPRRDGSYANPEPLVKEDDPLIATVFRVRAGQYLRDR
jgi:hypothetical protein